MSYHLIIGDKLYSSGRYAVPWPLSWLACRMKRR